MSQLLFLACFTAKLGCALKDIEANLERRCVEFQEHFPTWNSYKIAELVCDNTFTFWMEHTKWDRERGAVLIERRVEESVD